jgi:carbonic anhydrase/acetyltransferase-like protein (isoleucine patch superfamily)
MSSQRDRFGPDVALDDPAFIHPSAVIYGKANIGKGVSLWPNAVIRAEMFEVTLAPFVNVQDFVMIHVGFNQGTHIGAHTSITHHCTIHGATIGENCLIGINATIMDDCVIGDNTIVAGGAFLKEGTVIPPNSIVMGMPGKVVRSQNNWVENRLNAELYYRNALAFAAGNHRSWSGPEFDGWYHARREQLRRILDDGVQDVVELDPPR